MRAVGVVVAIAVLLAGCNSIAPAPQATPTTTPAPIPTPEHHPAWFAPGVTSENVDGVALAAAHASHLKNRSYTMTVNRTVRYANGSLRSQVVTQIRLSRDRSYQVSIHVAGQHATRVIGRPPAHAEFWSNGSLYIRKYSRENETVYNTFRPAGGAGTWRFWVHFFVLEGPAREDIAAIFEATDARVVDRGTVDGHRRVHLAAEGHESTEFVDIDEARAVGDVEVRAVVDERGFLTNYRVAYTATIDGDPVVVDRTVRYQDIGNTSADRPQWYDRAIT